MLYAKGQPYQTVYLQKGPGSGGVGDGGSEGQIRGGEEAVTILFLLSEEPFCAGDIITQHHLEGFSVFFQHFILQTKECFCTNTLFSCLVE